MAGSEHEGARETGGAHKDEQVVKLVHDLALEDYEAPSGLEFGSKERYVWLRETGSRLWLDTGDAEAAEKVWADELDSMTTNNALVNQVVQTGSMDGLITYAAGEIRKTCPGITPDELVVEIGFLVNARLALSLVQKFEAHVSVELHPDVGFDIDRTLELARRYYSINPEYFYIKVPLTPEGFVAVRRASAEGIPVNFTLGFSARQNYLASRFSNPSYANVFLGRLNSLVEQNSLGKPELVGEKAALASDEMVKNIRTSGASQTMQIAASIRNGEQVATLAGVDVLTIPPKDAAEYLEMEMGKDRVHHRNWRDLPVELQGGGPLQPDDFRVLWDIDEKFVGFVDDAVRRGDDINGRGLADLANQHGVNLFHDWTPDERSKLREQGKIPQTGEWSGIPLDDLMSMAGLEYFAKDQVELDERIKKLAE